jgi:FkbM family methyltransferase
VGFAKWWINNNNGGGNSNHATGFTSKFGLLSSAGKHVTKFVEPILEPAAAHEPYPPLSCSRLQEAVKRNQSVADPNKGEMYTTTTREQPKFQISVHNHDFDPAAWHIYTEGFYFEVGLHSAFTSILNATSHSTSQQQQRQQMHVLDVGGHIGYFSLLAAAHGNMIVDAFEPNLKNSIRLCESMVLNNWYNKYEQQSSSKNARINWHPYATGKSDSVEVFQEHPIDPGMGKVLIQEDKEKGKGAPDTEQGYQMRVISLDNFAQSRGWFQTKPDIAIFKVDVDGYEAHVMEGAKQLLASHIIRNIFMEAAIRTKEELKAARSSLLIISQAGYKVRQWGDAKGPQTEVDWSHLTDPEHIASQVIAQAAKHEGKFLNVWWTLK